MRCPCCLYHAARESVLNGICLDQSGEIWSKHGDRITTWALCCVTTLHNYRANAFNCVRRFEKQAQCRKTCKEIRKTRCCHLTRWRGNSHESHHITRNLPRSLHNTSGLWCRGYLKSYQAWQNHQQRVEGGKGSPASAAFGSSVRIWRNVGCAHSRFNLCGALCWSGVLQGA